MAHVFKITGQDYRTTGQDYGGGFYDGFHIHTRWPVCSRLTPMGTFWWTAARVLTLWYGLRLPFKEAQG